MPCPAPATRGRPQGTREACTSGSDNSNGKAVASWTMSWCKPCGGRRKRTKVPQTKPRVGGRLRREMVEGGVEKDGRLIVASVPSDNLIKILCRGHGPSLFGVVAAGRAGYCRLPVPALLRRGLRGFRCVICLALCLAGGPGSSSGTSLFRVKQPAVDPRHRSGSVGSPGRLRLGASRTRNALVSSSCQSAVIAIEPRGDAATE